LLRSCRLRSCGLGLLFFHVLGFPAFGHIFILR
jgi:hypothetical protein